MPVIGRLDGQVEEVLIAPLEKRRRQDAGEPPDDEPARGAADENRRGRRERAAGEEFGKGAGRDELPVWLL